MKKQKLPRNFNSHTLRVIADRPDRPIDYGSLVNAHLVMYRSGKLFSPSSYTTTRLEELHGLSGQTLDRDTFLKRYEELLSSLRWHVHCMYKGCDA